MGPQAVRNDQVSCGPSAHMAVQAIAGRVAGVFHRGLDAQGPAFSQMGLASRRLVMNLELGGRCSIAAFAHVIGGLTNRPCAPRWPPTGGRTIPLCGPLRCRWSR